MNQPMEARDGSREGEAYFPGVLASESFPAGLRGPVHPAARAMSNGAARAQGYLIDRDVRILALERTHDEPHHHEEPLLRVSNGSLLPADPALAERWKWRVNHVVTSGQGNLFMLGKQPCEGLVTLLPGPRAGTVHVRRPHRSVIDLETARAVARASGLSRREAEVFEHLMAGLSPKEISTLLKTSLSTVRSQVKSVLAKTGYGGMRDLVAAMACLVPIVPPGTAPSFVMVDGAG